MLKHFGERGRKRYQFFKKTSHVLMTFQSTLGSYEEHIKVSSFVIVSH